LKQTELAKSILSFPTEAAVDRCGLRVVALSAQRLMVVVSPEKLLVAAVRDDVIDNVCLPNDLRMSGVGIGACWMCSKKCFSIRLPS
jgi:hypothetical protein